MLKKLLKKTLNRFGYVVIKESILSEDIPEARSPVLPNTLLSNCNVVPSRDAILPYIPKGGVMTEIGVASGGFTRKILDQLKPEKLFAIDLFDYAESTTSSESHEELFKRKFDKEIASKQLELRKGYSWDELSKFPDAYFDYIYLDADHRYQAVVKDLEEIAKKIKPAGIIQFNDYTTFNPIALMTFGVQRAVNEFMLKHNYEMIHYALEPNNFCDVAIKKISG